MKKVLDNAENKNREKIENKTPIITITTIFLLRKMKNKEKIAVKGMTQNNMVTFTGYLF